MARRCGATKSGDTVTGLPVGALCSACGRSVEVSGHLLDVEPTGSYQFTVAILCMACCPTCSKAPPPTLRPMARICPTGRSMDFDEWFAGIPGAGTVAPAVRPAPGMIPGLDPPQQLDLLPDDGDGMTRGQAARIFQAVQDLHHKGIGGVDGLLVKKLAAERAVFSGAKLALARKLVEKHTR